MKRRRRIDDDDPIIPDGGRVRTQITLMDGINARDHQPHFADATDARRAALDARDAMIERARNSWRLSGRDAAQPDLGLRPDELMRGHLATESSAEAQAKRDRIWQKYRDELGQAWRMGRTDPDEAGRIERQGEQWRHGR